MRLYCKRQYDELCLYPGGDGDHEQQGYGRQGIQTAGVDQGQLPEIRPDKKWSDPEKKRYHSYEHSKTDSGREKILLKKRDEQNEIDNQINTIIKIIVYFMSSFTVLIVKYF